MKRNLFWTFLLVVMLMSSLGTMGWADDLDVFKGVSGSIKISGGTAHIPVMRELAKRVMSINGDIHFSIAGGGSGVGIKQVGEGLVDIGNSGRKPTDKEVENYGLIMHRWAIDGVGIVVNPANPVKGLSTDQLKAVYAGQIVNWKELGGPDKAINLYSRDEASGTRAVFWKKALGKNTISAKANVVPSNGAMKTAVAQDPFSIGYVSVGFIDSSVAPVSLDGVEPTRETVELGRYKVARGLYSNTRGRATGLTQKFLEYLYSPEGRQIIAAKGFIPVKE